MAARAFRWTEVREQAVAQLAEGRQSEREIAKALGIDRTTLAAWKRRPEFAARLRELTARFRERAEREALLRLEHRAKVVCERWQALRELARKRGEEMARQYPHVPGVETGYLVRRVRRGAGPRGEDAEEFVLDTGLLRALQEHEERAGFLSQCLELEHNRPTRLLIEKDGWRQLVG